MKILKSIETNDIQIVIGKNKHNWIIVIGKQYWNESTIKKRGEYYYFTDIKYMIEKAYMLFLRYSIDSFEIEEVENAINRSKSYVTKLAGAVAKRCGVQNGCK